MKVEGLIIHLSRAESRRPMVNDLLARLPIPTSIIEAVDARADVPSDELQTRVSALPLFQPSYPFGLNPGEVGCFLSHRKAWAEIVARDLDFGFIAEDDLGLLDDFKASFDFAVSHAALGDYISFQTRLLRGEAEVMLVEGRIRLMRPVVPPLRTTAQLVGRDAAVRLLAATERFDRPVDCFVQATWWTKQPILVVAPSQVTELSGLAGGSTAQGQRKKTVLDEIGRSIKRYRYRKLIAQHNVRLA